MITVSVTSDSTTHELHLVSQLIDGIIEHNTRNAEIKRESEIQGYNPSHVIVDETFNSTELAEAETLGKPVCSTVDAEVSQTAHVDMRVNTSVPTPQSVFGQPAQTAANVANPAAPATDDLAADADGLTWDSRIHSSSKEFNKDGTWRKRRGVNADLVAMVEAELRGLTGTLVDSNLQAIPAEHLKSSDLVNPIPAPKPPVDHSHEGETPVFTATIPTEMTFPELLDGVTKAMVAGQLTQARINEALNSIGVQALPHLITRTDLIPAFREALGGVV